MKHEYYIIAFKNEKTGESKEYYLYLSPEDIEEKARELRSKFFDEEEYISIHIYKLEKHIYAGE